MSRNTGSTRVRTYDYDCEKETMPRSNTDYLNKKPTERGRDTSLRRSTNGQRSNSVARPRGSSPAVRKTQPVPEFTTIQSKPKVGRSPSIDRTSRNAIATPPLEIKRTIHGSEYCVDCVIPPVWMFVIVADRLHDNTAALVRS